MHIHHIGIWTENIELMKNFYTEFFGCKAGEKYENRAKGFESYFLNFEDGSKIELMHKKEIFTAGESEKIFGLAHIAIEVENKDKVCELTDKLRAKGYKIFSEPRVTGDGYYESSILDPEGNMVEIVCVP
ncbi:MAG: VOC family protein [Brevinematia bacterium]